MHSTIAANLVEYLRSRAPWEAKAFNLPRPAALTKGGSSYVTALTQSFENLFD
jgi:hypothetical protein